MPVTSSEIVVEDVDPVFDPGFIVQLPDGRPLRITLPVASEHVGWVTVPTTGAVGVGGCSGITTSAERFDTHPAEEVTK